MIARIIIIITVICLWIGFIISLGLEHRKVEAKLTQIKSRGQWKPLTVIAEYNDNQENEYEGY